MITKLKQMEKKAKGISFKVQKISTSTILAEIYLRIKNLQPKYYIKNIEILCGHFRIHKFRSKQYLIAEAIDCRIDFIFWEDV